MRWSSGQTIEAVNCCLHTRTVLNAVREVDTAIDAYGAQQQRLKHLADALTAARRAVTLATERFDRGLIETRLMSLMLNGRNTPSKRNTLLRNKSGGRAVGNTVQIIGGRVAGLSGLSATLAAITCRCGGVPEFVGRHRQAIVFSFCTAYLLRKLQTVRALLCRRERLAWLPTVPNFGDVTAICRNSACLWKLAPTTLLDPRETASEAIIEPASNAEVYQRAKGHDAY